MEIENKTFDEINIGDKAFFTKKLNEKDIEVFARMSGDFNPLHVDEEFAKESIFHQRVAHGMWGGGLISTVLGTKLPGPGAIYLRQTLQFKKPVFIGDELRAEVEVKSKDEEKKRIIFSCQLTNQEKELVVTGEAEVIAPTKKIKRKLSHLKEVEVIETGKKHEALIEKAKKIDKRFSMGIVFPTTEDTLLGAIEAAEAGLISPIFIGPEKKMKEIAKDLARDISSYHCIDVEDDEKSIEKAISLVHEKEVDALMKGSLHTDVFIKKVISAKEGLRTDRKVSHCAVVDIPTHEKLLIFTDGAINILPTIQIKKDMIINAIDLAHAMDIPTPHVAILSATETILENIPSTLEAAILCKMAERGQIKGGIVDGPLAFDVAISLASAHTKHLVSEVAGQPDIFIFPNIESGNISIKALELLAYAEYAGVVLGAKVPIVLTSRSAPAKERLISSALAKIYFYWHQNTKE